MVSLGWVSVHVSSSLGLPAEVEPELVGEEPVAEAEPKLVGEEVEVDRVVEPAGEEVEVDRVVEPAGEEVAGEVEPKLAGEKPDCDGGVEPAVIVAHLSPASFSGSPNESWTTFRHCERSCPSNQNSCWSASRSIAIWRAAAARRVRGSEQTSATPSPSLSRG